ncbi:MAG: 30S ribosomal protein S9 [Candidatus Hydrothermarchaeaceae archaeon]
MKIIQTSGRRKTAIARAVIRSGKGNVRINKKPLSIWEPEMARLKIMEPLQLAGKLAERVDIEVYVHGGGFVGQADAVRTAVGRGLVEFGGTSELKDVFIEYDRTIVKGDHRRKETKKYGGTGARAKKQKSYR